jgi:hypothetical protein
MFFNILFFLSCLLSVHHTLPLPEIIFQSIEFQPTFYEKTQQFIQNYISFSAQEPNKVQVNPYDQFIYVSKNWNTEMFARFFNYHLHNRNIHEQQILTAYELYRYTSFQNYICKLTGFEEHIEQLHKHINHNKKCKHRVRHIAGLDRKQFSHIIKKLHQEILTARLAQQEQELQRKQWERQRTVMTQQHDRLMVLSAAWQNESEENDGVVAIRYNARIKAAKMSMQSNDRWYEQSYTVSAPARRSLVSQSISADTFGMLYGNILQHVLHKEFVDLVNNTALEHDTYHHNSAITHLSKTIFEFADIGREYIRNGAIVQASRVADMCWAALDCIQAIGEGVHDGVVNTVDMVLHPIQTVTNITKGVGMLAYHVGHVMYELTELDVLMDTDYEAAQKKFNDMSDCFGLVITALQKKQQELKRRDYFKGAASFVTECFLQARLIRGISSVCQSAQKQIPKLASQFGEYIPDKKILLSTTEGIEFEIAREAQDILQRSVAIGIPLGESASSCLTEFLFSVEKDIINLRQLFDCTRKGFGELAGKYIKIDYQHIFGVELQVGKKGKINLSGFHHDFMGAIEKNRVFDFVNVIKGKSGFYSADVVINGRSTYKTFFPQAWSREKVTSKIYEAFDNFIESGAPTELIRGDKYLVKGIIAEGITIEMYMTKSGKIVTAYPEL